MMLFHQRYDDGVRHVTVEAWTREDLVSPELLENADPEFIRVDRENGLLTFMVENGVATYRMGEPLWPGVDIPIFLNETAGVAPIADGGA